MSRTFSSLFRQRSILNSQKLLRRRRVFQIVKVVAGVFLVVGFIWSLSYASSAPQLTIHNVLVSGNSLVPTASILSVSNTALQGKYAWLFSRSNFLWYPKNEIINTLRYSYSWIDTVSVERKNLTTIEIKIKERVPVAVWCGVSRATSTPCKLMDAQGNLFATAPEFVGPAYLRLYGPLTSASWRGANFFSENGRKHIFAFTKGLFEIALQPVAVEVVTPSIKEEYAVFLSSGAQIYVQVSDPVDSIILNLQSILAQKTFARSASHNLSDLTFLDMRFGNKIFYKFKDDVSAVGTSTATSSKI